MWVTIVEHILGIATYAGVWLWGYQRGRRAEREVWLWGYQRGRRAEREMR